MISLSEEIDHKRVMDIAVFTDKYEIERVWFEMQAIRRGGKPADACVEEKPPTSKCNCGPNCVHA